MRSIQTDELPKAAGRPARQPPSDRRAPIVAGNREGLLPKMVRQPEHVCGELVEIIRIHSLRLVTQTITSLIRSNDVKAPLGQRLNLVSPAKPELRESVEQENQGTSRGAGLRYVQLDSVRSDPREPRMLIGVGHSHLFQCTGPPPVIF